MTQEEKIRYEEMAKVSKALAHPSRLFIVHKLAEQEYCVQDLTKMIGVDISTVSKHLAVLHNAGIIAKEKRGNCIYYSLLTKCVLNIFSCVMNVIDANKQKINRI